MTTRYEDQLAQIEADLRNPTKAGKVHPALKEHVRIQREREKLRIKLTKEIGTDIKMCWVEGKPQRWQSAMVQVVIGKKTYAHVVEPYEMIQGEQKLKSRIVQMGYEGMAQEWATWKWHTQRAAECDDNGHYILDCDPPEFVWEEVKVPA